MTHSRHTAGGNTPHLYNFSFEVPWRQTKEGLSLHGRFASFAHWPPVGDDWHPPSFDLAKFRVRHVDLQGQLRHPDGELQLSRQVQVGEVDHQRLPAAHLFAVHQNLVAVWGDLEEGRRRRKNEVGLSHCAECLASRRLRQKTDAASVLHHWSRALSRISNEPSSHSIADLLHFFIFACLKLFGCLLLHRLHFILFFSGVFTMSRIFFSQCFSLKHARHAITSILNLLNSRSVWVCTGQRLLFCFLFFTLLDQVQ